MALPTITLVNLTGGAIDLEQLAITVPASGSIDVTDFDRPDEVLNDEELQVEFDAGNLRINITGGQLTSADTTKTLEQSKAIVQPIHDLDIRHNLAGTTAPVAGDDEDDGYEVGSLWVDTTNDTYYVCADAASGAAVWVANGGGATVRIFEPGVITEALQFAIDFNNQSSWTPNQTTTWNDTIAGTAGTTTATTITGGHLNFNGTTSLVDFGTLAAALVNLYAGGGTCMAWIRAETDGESTTGGRIYDTTDALVEGSLFATFEDDGTDCRMIFLQAHASGFGNWETTARDVVLNEWTHVAVTYDSDSPGTPPVFYINGVSVAVTTNTTPSGAAISDSGNDLIIGNRTDAARTFDGDIEVVGLYDAAVTAEEIRQIYDSQRTRFRDRLGWGPVLVGGNTSDGTDPVVSVGDVLRGVDVSSGDGGALDISGGDTSSTAIAVDGGAVNIVGGSTASTNASGSAQGGDVNITGGAATAVTGQADGGAVNITGATPSTFNGTGGSVTIQSGDGGTGGGNANAGSITIQGGDGAVTTSTGGNISILGGSSTAGFSGGGDITITAGAHSSNSTGGALSMSAGDSVSGSGGDVDINGGDMTGSTAAFDIGGSITLTSGTGTTSPYGIGSIAITVPSPASPTTDNVAAGNVSITAGDNGVRNADGGNVDITAGDTWGFNQRFGGTITLTCGSDNNGNSFSEGGSVVLIPGTSVSGDDGMVKIDGTSTLQMLEKPSVVTGIAAGEGRWWVRNDVPNVPMFTDDAGTDWVLNANSVGGLQAAYEIVNTIVTDATNGDFDVSGTEAISLAASAASIFTVTNANLSMGTSITGFLDLDGASGVTVDSVFGGISLDCTGAGNFTSSGVLTLSTNDAGTASAILVTAGSSTSPATVGGAITITAGDGNTTALGGAASLIGGEGGATGAGGKANLIGGAGGSTSGTGGTAAIMGGTPVDGVGGPVTITATAGVGTNRAGGAVTIDAGAGVGTAVGGAVLIDAGDGGATGAGGGTSISAGAGGATSGDGGPMIMFAGSVSGTTDDGGNVTISAGTGGTASGDGGDVIIGSGAGADTAGDVRITAVAASAGAGTDGEISLRTENTDATTIEGEILWNTQASQYSGSEVRFRSIGDTTTDATITTILTVGSLSTNNENLKVKLYVTGQDANDNILSREIHQTWWRNSSGTINNLTAHLDNTQSSGTGGAWAITLTVAGSNIVARVTGAAATTINWMAWSEVQQGGMAV